MNCTNTNRPIKRKCGVYCAPQDEVPDAVFLQKAINLAMQNQHIPLVKPVK